MTTDNAAVQALRDAGVKTPEDVWTDICVYGFTRTAGWYDEDEQKLRDTVSVFLP